MAVVESQFQQQSWLGRTLAQARQGVPAAPIVARPAPPPARPCDCALDRQALVGGAAHSARFARHLALQEPGKDDAGAKHRIRRVLAVPDPLCKPLMVAPYSVGKLADDAGVFAEMDRYNFGGSFTRNLVMEGLPDAVDKIYSLAEQLLRELMKKYGLIEADFAAPSEVPPLDEREGTMYVRVVVDGQEEILTVDSEYGPMWEFGHKRGYGPEGHGQFEGKDWAYMSCTEREVFLVTTARRQQKLKARFSAA
mmetsp:Transcript_137182/g.426298  ORF Transcript_137182/g.426298 Transcript_137182/m.426298 type:complete len:252 (+) Transcript_137182:52-807(+)|eukprot:CAMPEP_0204560558 /NCGR_PEP_ID=MMETSP0661-20131031/32687_1 /ASSEMBLY_ACC=CAM_ASM_000606 /TAXON_ID=109239 /ORGANISM="Alexandrium margalefi, Strain AMGDE01CS-322" /LENGTH=251 /DNA_ID=CAMNT_0051567903 /DNA_START=52 /DNA_END=807 /DNA_ORIENTATION=+